MINLIGWIGAVCLASCALPQAIKTVRTKKADDISVWFLSLWLIGEVLTMIYVLPKLDFPLLFNYVANIILIVIILRYK